MVTIFRKNGRGRFRAKVNKRVLHQGIQSFIANFCGNRFLQDLNFIIFLKNNYDSKLSPVKISTNTVCNDLYY